jgi:hypothetical protein
MQGLIVLIITTINLAAGRRQVHKLKWPLAVLAVLVKVFIVERFFIQPVIGIVQAVEFPRVNNISLVLDRRAFKCKYTHRKQNSKT